MNSSMIKKYTRESDSRTLSGTQSPHIFFVIQNMLSSNYDSVITVNTMGQSKLSYSDIHTISTFSTENIQTGVPNGYVMLDGLKYIQITGEEYKYVMDAIKEVFYE